MSENEKPVQTPVVAPPAAPPADLAAAAIAAIAKDAKNRPEEYLKAAIVPGGGE